MSIIETFTKIINRGKAKTENVRTSDYVIGDFPFATPDAISAESAMRISTVYSCIRVRAESIAMLPLRLYEISKDGSRKRTGSGGRISTDRKHQGNRSKHCKNCRTDRTDSRRDGTGTGRGCTGGGRGCG